MLTDFSRQIEVIQNKSFKIWFFLSNRSESKQNLHKKMMESFRRVPVAAALVVFTSIATVYWVLLGSSSLPRKRVRGPRGLANYGKACYLNAVLQALASSSIIQSWLSKSSSPLQQSLLKCLKVLNRQEDDPSEEVSPTYLFSALRFKIFFFQQIFAFSIFII